MSLSLIQGYSSAEEEEEALSEDYRVSSDDDDEDDDSSAVAGGRSLSYKSVFDQSAPSNGSSGLPSALDVFSEVIILNLCVVVEAKAQLVGIHERVRSDIEANQPPTSSAPSTTQDGGKRVPTVTNPNAEDAAELLRMCLQCGIPKTYSSARGMVCPVCGDRPPNDTSKEPRRRGRQSKIKKKASG
ncbi:hypothetical protein GH714_000057 [Hevea brasiliensis]|uniref:Uncharacterized protein n=1 Tax=Hevea brasiliensis TaxID=3981 RepID=A0A6A6M9V3_HEVBR|nr:hypothetical protein GH714_000057 [Hevea brasiliensis]